MVIIFFLKKELCFIHFFHRHIFMSQQASEFAFTLSSRDFKFRKSLEFILKGKDLPKNQL
jgi:hypothetical protein